ncbi:MAG: uracil-DNA glycosylase [Treponema sp.]
MKKCEKEKLYSLFRVATECIEGFNFPSPIPTFCDDVPLDAIMQKASIKDVKVDKDVKVESSSDVLVEETKPRIKTGKVYTSFEEIKKDVLICQACPLCKTRKTVVFGEGPKETVGSLEKPPVLVIGEAPGYDEDVQGRPFVGASGKLLDKMLISIGLSRNENCFITNIVKCRPPENRNPAKEEVLSCSHFLEEQIRLLSPKMILLLGTVALKSIFNTTLGISHLHGKIFYYNDEIPTIATYHPSALLRTESLKRPAWEDLKFFQSKFKGL